MTLAPTKEDAMTPKAKPEQQARPIDSKQRRKELNLRISRLVAETIHGWHDCKIAQCRREHRCASDSFACIAKWRSTLPPITPEQAEARMQDFRIALDARRRLGGQSVTPEQLRKAIRKEQAARRAATPPQGGEDAPPAATQAPLSPEMEQRVPENSGEADRWIGPRIRQL
jgi:hypothetical protein